MRKIAANYVFPVTSPPIKNGFLVLSDENEILGIGGGENSVKETAGLEYYSGILIPGFINAHCHTELSHLKGQLKSGLGLDAFIRKIPGLRNQQSTEAIEKTTQQALRFMWSRGIQGLGDVVNTTLSLEAKAKSALQIHNFAELFNSNGKTEKQILHDGKELLNAFVSKNMEASYSPHSLYGSSPELINQILESLDKPSRVSLHYKEHPIEKEKSSIQNLEKKLHHQNVQTLILVHNLYLNVEELSFFENLDQPTKDKIYWALCPNSNLYIENQLPSLNALLNTNIPVCLGTDSLASNHQLSILDEMKTLASHFPGISFNELLKWATINGAKALGMDASLGSFEVDKKPGVLLLEGFDFKRQQITAQTSVTRLA